MCEGKIRGFLRWLCIVLALCPSPLFAQSPGSNPTSSQLLNECKPPESAPELLQALFAKPDAKTFEQLGLFYGGAGNPKCAIAAFQAALVFDPAAMQARYELALALIEDHQPTNAADHLRLVLQQQPDSFAAHNALGLALQDLGRSEQAANEFLASLKINPTFALADYDLAQLLSSQHSYAAAVYYLKRGLAASPSAALAGPIKSALVLAYVQLGDYQSSIPILQELLTSARDSADLHYDLATAHAHSKNYDDAVKQYKEVLRLDPSRKAVKLLLAKALLNQSNVEDCLPYLREYVQSNPRDAEGLEILGDALKESSHRDEAIEVLRRALKVNPQSYKVHYDLGVMLGRAGQLDEAIRELRAATQLNLEGSEARYQLAQLLARNKQDAASKEQFAIFEKMKAADDERTRNSFLATQANRLLEQGMSKEAVAAYGKAIAADPHDAKLHYNFAVALAKVGDQSAEQRELRKAIALDSKFAQAHNALGSTLLLDDKLSDAEREFKIALDSDPQSVEALNNLGRVLGREGKNNQSEHFFRRATLIDPQSPLGFVNLGVVLADEKKYLEAEEQLRAALQLDPKNASALTALGMLQGKTGRATDSVATFRKLVDLSPDSADAHVNLGMALADANDLESALAQFSEAVRLDPNSAHAEYNRGRVLYALHRNVDAGQALDNAVRLSPKYIDALFLLGTIEHSSPRATQLFAKVVELQPANAQARFYLGRNLLQEGKKTEAVAQWKKAVELDPENLSAVSSLARVLTQEKSPEAKAYTTHVQALEAKQQLADRVRELNNFALRSAEQKDWTQAVSQLQEAITLCQSCAELGVLRKNIGLIYVRKGDVEGARRELQLAMKLLPEGADMAAATQALQQLNAQPAGASRQ